jgi:hypothetical protein
MDNPAQQPKPPQSVPITPAGKEGESVSLENMASASNEVALDNEVKEVVQVVNDNPILTPAQQQAGVEYSPESMPVSQTNKIQITIPEAQAGAKKKITDSFTDFCILFLRVIRKANFLKLKKASS